MHTYRLPSNQVDSPHAPACGIDAGNQTSVYGGSAPSGGGRGGLQAPLPQDAAEARTPPTPTPHTPSKSKSLFSSKASQSSTPPHFSGDPGEDATIFVNSIQKIAFAQGRQRDNNWQADYAATCLTGPAMRWYCDLEDEERLSWSDLRRALLQRFPPLPAPTSPPAAPPPAPASSQPYQPRILGTLPTHHPAPDNGVSFLGPQGGGIMIERGQVSMSEPETRATSRPIYFYSSTKPYYCLTNFSPHSVMFRGKVYPTSEHLFQAMKAGLLLGVSTFS
ncbi:hypothetical protein FRB94_000616 [Tulasnella sp. JGI-2019a]|nr:hypothetical protein FRB94_000616 [Tulasnella sp. JGI-2019a]